MKGNADLALPVCFGEWVRQPNVGMEVSTPVRMPVGQRAVMVLRRV